MILAIIWSTQGGRYSSIFEAINAIGSDLAPPITTVFLWGVLWKRGTKQAAITTLISGFLMGITAFVLDLPVFGTKKIITEGLGIHFLMQAWWMFVICSIIYVTTSLLTPKPEPSQIEGLTWKSPKEILIGKRITGIADPRLLAAFLFALMVVLYFIFR
jgi:SSS family solute:Na+ symporter